MGFDIVIAPSLMQVEGWRKRCADNRAPEAFGQTVVTFDAWIADLWELHGDGRRIVEAAQRDMMLRVVTLDVMGDEPSRGIAAVAAECMRVASGLPELEQVMEEARGNGLDPGVEEGGGGASFVSLPPREQRFVHVLAAYEEALRQLGLVEVGHAAAYLADRSATVFTRRQRVLVAGSAPLTWIQQRFFSACPQLEVTLERTGGEGGVARAPEGVEVRFAFPSGELAEPGLVADAVEAHGDTGAAVITCADPVDLFERLGGRLDGRRLCVQARKPFAQTDFGRAFLACWRCVNESPWDPSALSDVLVSPFSGMTHADAVRFDVRMRLDRLLQREAALQEARVASEAFSQLEELASDPDADVLIGVFEQRVQADVSRSDAWRAEQLAALRVLGSITAAARLAGANMEACVDVLKRVSVPISARSGCEGGAEVIVTTLPLAAQLQPGSCSLLVAADLTSDCYPVADKDDAASTFFSHLGLTPFDSALARARRDFNALLALPTRCVMLMRPLGDANADPTYPAAVLEEFVDAYRPDPSATDDIDNAYRLPENLQEGLLERGEELLFANAKAAGLDGMQTSTACIDRPSMDDIDESQRFLVMPPRHGKDGVVLDKACPSPSQIEVFLECPFRWFVERRLHVEGIDEGFGPLERGSFAHAVLEEFYRRFQATGRLKVREEDLPEARALMRAVAEEVELRQGEEEAGSGRYVAMTELERRDVAALREQLVSFLDFEAQLLPTFHPAYLEYEIDADHAVDYAGYALVGKVDRIDVDDDGNAVIIDYKGSVNGEHEIAGKTWGHAGKVQTRVYARAVERALGVRVVGALYVSYGRRPALAGAYDSRVLEAAHLPGMKHDHCACGVGEAVDDRASEDYAFSGFTFEHMLDETEALAGEAISLMKAGSIAPDPAYADACKYCSVLSCERRGV